MSAYKRVLQNMVNFQFSIQKYLKQYLRFNTEYLRYFRIDIWKIIIFEFYSEILE